eukprot:4159908-Pleurochrysis_carterae.AAC.2
MEDASKSKRHKSNMREKIALQGSESASATLKQKYAGSLVRTEGSGVKKCNGARTFIFPWMALSNQLVISPTFGWKTRGFDSQLRGDNTW